MGNGPGKNTLNFGAGPGIFYHFLVRKFRHMLLLVGICEVPLWYIRVV